MNQFIRSFFCLVSVILFAFSLDVRAADPWDLTWLLDADPNKVTSQDLAEHAFKTEENFTKYHNHDGMAHPAVYSNIDAKEPDFYGSNADTTLFSGFYLGATVYRFLVTQQEEDLDKVMSALRGIHILSHISGTPGVIMRLAIPESEKEKWRYPKQWQSRIDNGFIYESPTNIKDPFRPGQNYPKMIFYTRTSRDQFTGMVFGLAVAWKHLSDPQLQQNPRFEAKIKLALNVLQDTVYDLYKRLEKKGYKLLDHKDKGGINANDVSSTLRAGFLGIAVASLKDRLTPKEYDSLSRKHAAAFHSATWLFGGDAGDLFLFAKNAGGYFPWNLNHARDYTVALIDDNPEHKKMMANHIVNRLYKYTSSHQNAWFLYAMNSVLKMSARANGTSYKSLGLKDALYSIQSVSLRPSRGWPSPLCGKEKMPPTWQLLFGSQGAKYVIPPHLREPTGYFLWQKDPWSTGDKCNPKAEVDDATGLDFLLPYWIARYWGFIKE